MAVCHPRGGAVYKTWWQCATPVVAHRHLNRNMSPSLILKSVQSTRDRRGALTDLVLASCTVKKKPRARPPSIRMCVVTDSTNIAAVGYAPKRRLLRVRFRDGSEYEYNGIQAATYATLISSKSIGEHFAAEIRGKFTATRKRRPRTRAHAS